MILHIAIFGGCFGRFLMILSIVSLLQVRSMQLRVHCWSQIEQCYQNPVHNEKRGLAGPRLLTFHSRVVFMQFLHASYELKQYQNNQGGQTPPAATSAHQWLSLWTP